jgi:hypothetical protein
MNQRYLIFNRKEGKIICECVQHDLLHKNICNKSTDGQQYI